MWSPTVFRLQRLSLPILVAYVFPDSVHLAFELSFKIDRERMESSLKSTRHSTYSSGLSLLT